MHATLKQLLLAVFEEDEASVTDFLKQHMGKDYTKYFDMIAIPVIEGYPTKEVRIGRYFIVFVPDAPSIVLMNEDATREYAEEGGFDEVQ